MWPGAASSSEGSRQRPAAGERIEPRGTTRTYGLHGLEIAEHGGGDGPHDLGDCLLPGQRLATGKIPRM
jgi:hypothetical protein